MGSVLVVVITIHQNTWVAFLVVILKVVKSELVLKGALLIFIVYIA